ncbi:hypothetical protein [Campylobacter gracilis]|uniref:Uncharacterized protein n=1 Tax=Campylobacter gracilis RM3268 TaxID=553220 RepID=C8PI60_9BACT|nr:hypothetical protein [Campylobacter gracilis]EEV17450.1 hypothetical protein CAMGR0001_0041 [Campylobacter gracilis RM3268]UEB46190.1 hypothetical protein LK410_03595 [Campylobacter gracilis]SUW77954.1 Uncharacterised protein [Campylobacter gracilis]
MEYFKPFFVKIPGRAREDDHTARMIRSSRRYCKMRSPPTSITAAKIV